jgi:hypothetical protein
MRYFIDCEFDGHNGPLLSLAIVPNLVSARSLYVTTDAEAKDPWVIENVVPLLDQHRADAVQNVPVNMVGHVVRGYLSGQGEAWPVIIADSPVDIGRFCRVISTGADGEWASTDFARMTFEVRNVSCYPTTLKGAVQHNAWWDAMALRRIVLGEK